MSPLATPGPAPVRRPILRTADQPHHDPDTEMNPLRILPLLCLATSLLSACVVIDGPSNTYQIGRDVTRTDSRGDTKKLSAGDGWITSKLPEAKISRQTVWSIAQQESGIKAWRYGYSSEDNRRYLDPLSPIVAASNVSATGWVTYLVQGDKEKDFIVKRAD